MFQSNYKYPSYNYVLYVCKYTVIYFSPGNATHAMFARRRRHQRKGYLAILKQNIEKEQASVVNCVAEFSQQTVT